MNANSPGHHSEMENKHENGKYSLAWWLDSSIPFPGGYRIGFDGIIGLVPGLGDVIGGGLSTWIFFRAYQEGAPKFILARMLINILVDSVLGAIPVIGDIFDFVWKANQRNLALLQSYHRKPTQTYRRAAGSSVVFFVGFFAIVIGLICLMILLVRAVWHGLVGQ